MSFAAIMFGGLLIDLIIGWPGRLYRMIRHPVVWLGALISKLDATLNSEQASDHERRWLGVLTVFICVACAAGVGLLLQMILPAGWPGLVFGALLAWPLMALRSMYAHVVAVYHPLAKGDIATARAEVAKIVGRDPSQLDEAAIARAACESLAENTSDGIVAPIFWGVMGGLPGLFAYKAINTLDSMIGYRTPRHREFGWAAARLDDVVNLIPARLTGVLFALVSNAPKTSLSVMWRDAGHHRSPNAGWPEAAMAGALGIRLSGPRIYDGRTSDEPWVNAVGQDPAPCDLERALNLYRRAMGVMALMLLALMFI